MNIVRKKLVDGNVYGVVEEEGKAIGVSVEALVDGKLLPKNKIVKDVMFPSALAADEVAVGKELLFIKGREVGVIGSIDMEL